MEKGYYKGLAIKHPTGWVMSQSTIKMEKGYYQTATLYLSLTTKGSQSTIKMEKGYYHNFQTKEIYHGN